jgi:hypothetical protein
MSAPLVPVSNLPGQPGEPDASAVLLPVQQATLAGVEEMLDRQRTAFLRQTHDMLVDAVDRVVTEHGTPLADQLRASLVKTLEEVQRQQMEPFFEKTRETIQDVVNQVTEERLRPLVNDLREALLRTVDDLQKQQLDPLLARTRLFLLGMADELRDKYTAPLADQVRKVLLDTVDEMRRKHGQPFIEVVNRMRDDLLGSLTKILAQPIEKFIAERVPAYTDWAGKRILNFTLAAALFCVAVVLVALGTSQALTALGVPNWCSFLAVGLAALLFGLLFYVRWRQLGAQVGPRVFSRIAEAATTTQRT